MNMFKDLELVASKATDRCLTETIDRLAKKRNAKELDRRILLAFGKEQIMRNSVFIYTVGNAVV